MQASFRTPFERSLATLDAPDSRVKDLLLELASLLDDPSTSADQVAVAAGAFRTGSLAFHDVYKERTRLGEQAECGTVRDRDPRPAVIAGRSGLRKARSTGPVE